MLKGWRTCYPAERRLEEADYIGGGFHGPMFSDSQTLSLI